MPIIRIEADHVLFTIVEPGTTNILGDQIKDEEVLFSFETSEYVVFIDTEALIKSVRSTADLVNALSAAFTPQG